MSNHSTTECDISLKMEFETMSLKKLIFQFRIEIFSICGIYKMNLYST